ncbi:hypothetical protein [Brucella pseudogrignonensis]|uniref:LamG domain-containing protein n=1 Tax=Brucella pseudogrignonensis TaxID=419475 RepID=A0ABU1M5K5_9HYPH|nr:hypothetical protein [Brucella pseudogrignonensis]MDR6431309.1 hypothetical protein [Brucella pseudogrignonensis]
MAMVLRSDADASAYSKKMLSSQQPGLILLGVFDTSEGKATNNFSLSGADETWEVVGTPTIGLTGTEFKARSNFLQTEVQEPAGDLTVMCVGRALHTRDEILAGGGAFQPLMVGSYAAVSGQYSGIAAGFSASTGNFSVARAIRRTDGSTVMLTANMGNTINYTTWHLFAMRFNTATRTVVMDAITHGVKTTNVESDTGAVAVRGTDPRIRIGSGYTSQSGPSAISQVRMWNRYLSDAALAEVAAEMRLYELEHNGRTV